MDSNAPNIIILAGPNGAGKSTISKSLFQSQFQIAHFVNADTIARGLSGFNSESMAIKSGRIMLEHLNELANQEADFAFETTLAIERVKTRVRLGGHHVPNEIVRRRYQRGLSNSFGLYRPLANSWKIYDHSDPNNSRLVAEMNDTIEVIHDSGMWRALQKGASP